MHRWSRGVFAVAMTEPRTRRADGDFNITNQIKHIKQIKSNLSERPTRVCSPHARGDRPDAHRRARTLFNNTTHRTHRARASSSRSRRRERRWMTTRNAAHGTSSNSSRARATARRAPSRRAHAARRARRARARFDSPVRERRVARRARRPTPRRPRARRRATPRATRARRWFLWCFEFYSHGRLDHCNTITWTRNLSAARACDFAPFLATRATATFERAARVWRAVWCERATPVDARSSVARGDARRDRARAWWRMTTRATLTSNLSRAAFVR